MKYTLWDGVVIVGVVCVVGVSAVVLGPFVLLDAWLRDKRLK